MKICFVLEHFYPHIGGVETEFLEIAKNLVDLKNEVRVVTSDSGNLDGHQIKFGINIFYYKWLNFFGHPIPNKYDINEHIMWADVVHTTTYTAALPTLTVCRKLKKKCILTVQEVLRIIQSYTSIINKNTWNKPN